METVTCYKAKYRTAADAEYQIKLMQKRKGDKYIPMSAYHCKDCDLWHLTSKEGGKKFALVDELEKRCEAYKKQVGGLSRAIDKRDQIIKELTEKLKNLPQETYTCCGHKASEEEILKNECNNCHEHFHGND